MDCEFIATGHYAKIKQQNNHYYISKGVDPRKDQSYVLWGLDQACMARTMFPLADLTKNEIRQMAHDWGYEELSNKPESNEICFVPDNDYRGFLRRRAPELEGKLKGGSLVDQSGKVIVPHICSFWKEPSDHPESIFYCSFILRCIWSGEVRFYI